MPLVLLTSVLSLVLLLASVRVGKGNIQVKNHSNAISVANALIKKVIYKVTKNSTGAKEKKVVNAYLKHWTIT